MSAAEVSSTSNGSVPGGTAFPYPPVKAAGVREFYPVSPAQKRFYVIDRQFGGMDTSYNTPQILVVEGQFDQERAEKALRQLVERCEVFRTTFEFAGGEAVQKVHDSAAFQMEYHECAETRAENAVKDFIRPFDLGKAPLLRAAIVRLQDAKYLLMFDMHHILSDDISLSVFTCEFFTLYDGAALPETGIQYKDYAVWLDELQKSGLLKKQEDYWVNIFRSGIPVLNLPYDFEKPEIQSYEGDRVVFLTGKDLSRELFALAAETGTNIYLVLMAAYYVLLSRITGQEDIVAGTIVSGRSVKEIGNTLGMFANMLALRNYPCADKRFASFLAEVQRNTAGAFLNQDYPFEKLVDRLGIRRSLGSNPIFETMFLVPYFNIPLFTAGDLKIAQYNNSQIIAKLDLRLICIATEQDINCILEYRTGLFKRETIQRMSLDYLKVLGAVTLDKNSRIGDIDTGSEQKKAEKAVNEEIEFDF